MTTISRPIFRYKGKKVGNATNNLSLIIDTEINIQKHAAVMLHFMQVPTHNNNIFLCLFSSFLPSIHHLQFLVHKRLSKTNRLYHGSGDNRHLIVACLHSSIPYMKIPIKGK